MAMKSLKSLKSLKGKVAVGVLATGLIAGMGTVFAATDIGGQFQSWYNTNITKNVSDPVTTKASLNLGSELVKYGFDTIKLPANSKSAVLTNQKEQSTTSTSTINSTKNDYVNQVETAKNSLSSQLETKKQALISLNQGLTNAAVEVTEKGSKALLDGAVNKQGNDSTDQVKKDIEAIQKAATDELSKKIQDSKADLLDLMSAAKSTADAEIRKNLDAKIAELRKTINEYAAALVKTNNEKVNAAAATATTDALNALDAVANSIK